MRNRLKNWREKLPLLPDPKTRPNDFQRLILMCLTRGLTIRDAERVFGVSEKNIQGMKTRYETVESDKSDLPYFMNRARELGADDEVIAKWFGFDRVDKVSMILADK